jgi:hypothetical protein
VASTRSDVAARSARRRRPTRTAPAATGTVLPSGPGNRRHAPRTPGVTTTSTSVGRATPTSASPDSSTNLAPALPHQAKPPEHAARAAVPKARAADTVGPGAVVRMRNPAVTAGAQPSSSAPRHSVFGVDGDGDEHQTLPPTVTKLPTGGRHHERPFRSRERRLSSRQPDAHWHPAQGRRFRSTASWHRSARTNRISAPLSLAGHPLDRSWHGGTGGLQPGAAVACRSPAPFSPPGHCSPRGAARPRALPPSTPADRQRRSPGRRVPGAFPCR